jgi:hypothetical protein
VAVQLYCNRIYRSRKINLFSLACWYDRLARHPFVNNFEVLRQVSLTGSSQHGTHTLLLLTVTQESYSISALVGGECRLHVSAASAKGKTRKRTRKSKDFNVDLKYVYKRFITLKTIICREFQTLEKKCVGPNQLFHISVVILVSVCNLSVSLLKQALSSILERHLFKFILSFDHLLSY